MPIQRLLALLLLLALSACQPKQKFDKTLWAERADLLSFPHRKDMVDDLVQNYPLKGMRYPDLVALLGPPQSKLDSTLRVFYDIELQLNMNIEPVYSKSLVIEFDKDTVVHHYEVLEWEE